MTKSITLGILCATADVELPALLRAFNLSEDEPYIEMSAGERYWHTSLKLKTGEAAQVVVSCAGLSGNTEVQLPVERMIQRYQPEFMIFVGIACGLPKFELGDVLTSGAIWAYEYVKTTPTGELDRSRARITPRHVQDDVIFLKAPRLWHNNLAKDLSKVAAELLPRVPNMKPKLHQEVWIASGEKVMANGELLKLNVKHDLIRAGEMEGYGFAVACEDRRPPVPWLVIRGVSDRGDPSKDGAVEDGGPIKDEFHVNAAQAAATYARSFLRNGYTPLQASTQYDIEGFRNVFSSDHDPRFMAELMSRVRKARREITFAGMGLGFLKGNTELVTAVAESLKAQPKLRVSIFYGDPENRGIKNRAQEEEVASQLGNRSYRRGWPKEHLSSLVKSFQNALHRDVYDRISLSLSPFLPTITIVRVDDAYLWYPYGTPNLRGKDSPWLLIDGASPTASVRKFLDANLAYYQRTKGASILTASDEPVEG